MFFPHNSKILFERKMIYLCIQKKYILIVEFVCDKYYLICKKLKTKRCIISRGLLIAYNDNFKIQRIFILRNILNKYIRVL